MSTATTSSAPDLASQWAALSDADVSLGNVEELLKHIQDELWVPAACADRILDDVAAQQALLDLGVERTTAVVERVRKATAQAVSGGDEELESPVEGTEDSSQRARHAALASYFAEASTDAQLCRIRALLLERLDKLNTWIQICREAPVSSGNEEEEPIDEEWEDDPWADESDAPERPAASKPGEAPVPLSAFLTASLVETACLLASQEYFAALGILYQRHGDTLWPFRFSILDCIPEYVYASEYKDLLPSCDMGTGTEQRLPTQLWREDTDFVETPECAQALEECRPPLLPLPVEDETWKQRITPKPLSSSDLSAWYLHRVDDILLSTGMVDAALALVQHAASQGVTALDEAGEELSLMARLVYDAPQGGDSAAQDWSLERWRSMTPSDVIRAYLVYSTETSIAQDIHTLVMPYLFVLESRAERAGQSDPSLSTRLLYEYILNARLDIVAAIFEASKPILPAAQRIIRDDEDMARLALACLYGSESLDEWPTMSRIFECLPAWPTPEESEDDADETDTTIASLGDFVTPSTTKTQATPADLFLFFKPLPTTSLSRALDVLDVHLESGEILSRWSVPAPLRWFLRSNSNIGEQRSRANRMARRANASDDKLVTQEDWEWLLEDMLKLSGSGEGASRSAFCLLSRDDVIRTFFSGLLSTGSKFTA